MPTSQNRTKWPLKGGAVSIQPGWFPGHSNAQFYINMGYGNEPLNYSHNAVPVFQITGPSNQQYDGTFCLPQVPLPANYTPLVAARRRAIDRRGASGGRVARRTGRGLAARRGSRSRAGRRRQRDHPDHRGGAARRIAVQRALNPSSESKHDQSANQCVDSAQTSPSQNPRTSPKSTAQTASTAPSRARKSASRSSTRRPARLRRTTRSSTHMHLSQYHLCWLLRRI